MVFNNQRISIIEKLSRIKDNNPGNIGFYHGKLAKHLQESPSGKISQFSVLGNLQAIGLG